VQASGRTGFYFRVVDAGAIRAGEPLELIDRPHPRLTVAAANRVMHRGRHDRRAMAALLVPELSASWTGTVATARRRSRR
jgi:MOSC domain-containing protein YiiM